MTSGRVEKTDSEIVGRERELGLLGSWLTAALEGSCRLVLCCGEPGIGKTRLAGELVTLAEERGVPVVWGRGVETGGPPYWPWQQVLGEAAELVDPATLVAESGFAAADLVPLLPELGPRLGVKAAADAGRPEERLRLFDAVSRFLRACAARDGLVVVLDDLHCSDRPSLLLLLHLMRLFERHDTRLLVFATYRVTETAPGIPLGDILPDLMGGQASERLDLGGLGEDAVRFYLSAISHQDAPVETARRVHDMTGGNPFLVGELGRELREDARLARRWEQQWPIAVPHSVRGAIRRRLERLSPACQELLRAASIVGREFPVGVVAAMRGTPALVCLDLLDEACAAGMVEPVRSPGRYRFVHDLIRDAVEADLASAARVRLHREAAEAIEDFYARHIEPHLSDLARHWAVAAAAGEGHAAATWAARAGVRRVNRTVFSMPR